MNDIMGETYEFKVEDEVRFINRNHNHADYDEVSKEWIHRKGATHAEVGMRGVIPGNMRDGSFVVIGKGNTDSLNSSSHGAGRVMSRKKARANVDLEDFKASMKGITGTVDENTLDESPFAYKDIFEVMKLQDELVDVVEHIKVLINVKDNSKGKY
jgi:tRNA-splicing ligase RtcB